MNRRLLARGARGLLLSILLIPVASCESDSAAYRRGWVDGYGQGSGTAAASREEGRLAGFKEGYEAARPTSGNNAPTGMWHTLSRIVMVLGMAKIVLSLSLFVLLMILDSSSTVERLAKITATSLGMIVVFWLSNTFTVGFSQPLTDVLLAPAAGTPIGKLLTGLLAAAATWASFWALEIVADVSSGETYVQTAFVLVASGLMSILIPLFVSLTNAPNINGYRSFDLILGVVIGGIFWLVHRLLVASEGGWKPPRGWKVMWSWD